MRCSQLKLTGLALCAGALAVCTASQVAEGQAADSVRPRSARADAAAQSVGAIRGTVRATNGQGIESARVLVVELQRALLTDSAGRFLIASLPAGSYRLSVARIGFAPVLRAVTVAREPVHVAIEMAETGLELSTVQISATASATTPLEVPQAMATLGGEALRQAQGFSVGETLEPVTGVRSISMTTGIGKPVIRGLSSQRVVTLDNGQRVESQQWGTDHAPTFETRDAERIEVVKGPASVLYGSDAIGGVVNVVARPLPDAGDGPAFVTGSMTALYDANLRGPDATLALEGARGALGWRTSITGRAMGDMRTPDGVLSNTQNRTGAALAAVGWRADWGTITARASHRDERIEILDDPISAPDYTGFQRIGTQRIKMELRAPLSAGRLEVDAGYEHNSRREFDDVAAAEHALGLTAHTGTMSAHWHHAPIGVWSGLIGVSGMAQQFRKSGTETLVPDASAGNVALYGFEQATLGRFTLSAGGRWDLRTISAANDDVLGLEATSRRWTAFSGNAGATYAVTPDVALVTAVARGFRSPWYNELFANGFHEGTRAFEVGNPLLDVETSLNTDVGVRVRRRTFTLDAGLYSNRINNYIYLRPLGADGQRFDSLEVVQGDAWLRGAEANATVQPVRWLTVDAGADLTVGDNRTEAVALPFVPPARGTWGVRITDPSGRRKSLPYVQLSGERHAEQRRLDPNDIAPPGYTLWHAAAGLVLNSARGPVHLDIVARNLGDVRYRPFLSRYKEFADALGRTVQLRVSVGLP